MRYPSFLQEQGTIGFAAPSFGCATEPYKTAFLHAQEKLAGMGYRLDLGPNCYAREGIGISNTPEKCGRELTEYLLTDKNDILISCGGGELMCETLDFVDFDAIRKAQPKWYESDLSAYYALRYGLGVRAVCRILRHGTLA